MEEKIMKIDIHCHTTNRKVEGVLDSYPSLETITKSMRQHDIVKTVLLATYFPHRGTGVSNFRLLNWTENRNDFMMFGSLDFDHFFPQGFNELEEMAERNLMKGIKIYTSYQHIDLKSSEMNKVLGLAEKHYLPVMFHVGYSYSCKSKCGKYAYTEMVSPDDLEFLLDKYNTNFIFSHLAKPFFRELTRVVNRHANVYSDSSGLISSKQEFMELDDCADEIRRFLEKSGPSKLLFGTDFPVQSHNHSVYMVEQAMKSFSDEDKRKVYFDNAWGLLKLK